MGITDGFDPIKVIKAALGNGGEFADIYVEDTFNTSIVSEENRIEKVVAGRDRGAGVRVIAGPARRGRHRRGRGEGRR
jgi:TldD protein